MRRSEDEWGRGEDNQMSMDKKPQYRFRLARQFKVLPVGPSRALLQSHLGSALLQEPWSTGILQHLLPLLQEPSGWEEIAAQLQPLGFGDEDIAAVLRTLESNGVLEPVVEQGQAPLPSRDMQRYADPLAVFAHFSFDENRNQDLLQRARVLVVGLGTMGSHLVRVLALSGVGTIGAADERAVDDAATFRDSWYEDADVGQLRCRAIAAKAATANPTVTVVPVAENILAAPNTVETVADYDVVVAAFDEYVPQVYEGLNHACLQAGTVWTRCLLQGFNIEVGPMIIPHETPCYICYRSRHMANRRDHEERLLLESHAKRHPFRWESLHVSLGGQLAALEILKLLSGCASPVTFGRVFSFNVITMESRLDTVLKLPRCPACSPAGKRPAPIVWGG